MTTLSDYEARLPADEEGGPDIDDGDDRDYDMEPGGKDDDRFGDSGIA